MKPCGDFTIAANTFVNLGLIGNETGGSWEDDTSLELNIIGETLHNLLEKEDWYVK